MGRSINTNQIIKNTILQSNDNKKIIKIKDKKNTKLCCCTSQFYLLLLQLNIKKLMQFMIPNKLFRVTEFAWKLGYSVCKCII